MQVDDLTTGIVDDIELQDAELAFGIRGADQFERIAAGRAIAPAQRRAAALARQMQIVLRVPILIDDLGLRSTTIDRRPAGEPAQTPRIDASAIASSPGRQCRRPQHVAIEIQMQGQQRRGFAQPRQQRAAGGAVCTRVELRVLPFACHRAGRQCRPLCFHELEILHVCQHYLCRRRIDRAIRRQHDMAVAL